MLQEFRCIKCNKLLGKIEGRAEIICTRCKVLNAFNVPNELRKTMDDQNDQSYEMFRLVNLGLYPNNNATDEWVKEALRRHSIHLPEDASVDDLRAIKEIEQVSLVEDGETLLLILSGKVIGKRLPVHLYADGTVYHAEYKYEIH